MNRAMKNYRHRQQGFLLLECLFYIVITAFLAMGMIGCFFTILKQQQYAVHCLTLDGQLQFAAGSLVRDLTYAVDVEIREEQIAISTRRKGNAMTRIVYALNNGRLMKNNQPMTGDEAARKIRVEKFICRKYNETTVLIELQAVHRVTGKKFSLETAAVLLNHPLNCQKIAVPSC